MAALVSIPTIGGLSYPGARSGAVAGKLFFLGPKLAEAMTNPNTLEAMIKLQSAPANSVAAVAASRSMLSALAKSGIRFSLRSKMGQLADYTVVEKDGKFSYDAVDQPEVKELLPINPEIWK
jgi:hypothetical protein